MKTVLLLLIVCTNNVFSAVLSGDDIAKNLRENQYSAGFQARFNVLHRTQKGVVSAPMQLILIGQVNAQQRRFLLRRVSSNTLNSTQILIEQTENTLPKILQLDATNATPSTLPAHVPLLESALQAIDLLSPWWSWQQSLGASAIIQGKKCQILHSVNPSKQQNLPYQRAESCIDLQQNLALRIQIFNANNIEVRRFEVLKSWPKSSGNGYFAKKFRLTTPTREVTEFEIYSGDEEYQINDQTFAALKFDRQ